MSTFMSCKRQNQHPIPSSSILFFNIIFRTNLERGDLNIPYKFTRIYGGDLPNPVFLKPPDGTEWKVHWTEHDDGIWFEKGWTEFATYYSLDHGHMVLFKYKESSHFKVHIFDTSALEIEYPFHASQDEESNSVETLDEPPPCQKIRQKSPVSCPQPRKKLRTDTFGDVGRSSNLPNMYQHVELEGNHQSKETNFQKSTSVSPNKELDEKMGGSIECIKVEQEEVASETADPLSTATGLNSKTTNPSFKIAMTPSYLSGTFLYIPLEFAKNHLKGKEGNTLLLVLDGKSWPVKYVLRKFSAGWKKFVSDNHLKVGDVCLFELTNSQYLSLKARIFRVSEESYSPPPFQVIGDGLNGKEIVPKRIPDVEIKVEKVTQRVSLPITPHPLTNAALEKADEFASANPFFTVEIKAHNRHGNSPNVPRAFAREHLNDRQSVMLQFGNKLCPVKLLRYSNKSQMSGGWALFVKESKVIGGDVCVFELINKEDAVLYAHIFRGHG